MNARLLNVEGLTTRFRSPRGIVNAVNSVSFDVERGEIAALVGESGCGKSATALSLLRLIHDPPGRIAGGRVLFDNVDLLALPPREMRRIRGGRIAMVFQDASTSLSPVTTVGRQLTDGMREHLGLSRSGADDRAVELLGSVGVVNSREFLGRYPHQLSGGMKQRVMIAMAISCNPELVIADEPTTALDVTIQAQIFELLKTLSDKLGIAFILITHNLGLVARYARRINVMYAGRIVEKGLTGDIFENPVHPYIRGLLHSVPRLDLPKMRVLPVITGQPPDLANLPPTCAFLERCPLATDRCRVEPPPEFTVVEGHVSTCWLAGSAP